MAEIHLENVTKLFPGDVAAVDDVSLEIADGEFLVLVGPSGCGKTTLLRMIAGLEEVTDGLISIGGAEVTDLAPRRRDVAMVFQSYALYPHMSVRQNLAYGLKVRRTPKAEVARRVDEVAKLLGLDDLLDRRPAQLSGGQRQRIALARVILKDAPILVLDEATSALDSEVEAAIQEPLGALMEGRTVIAIAHRLSTICSMDRLVVLDRGRIVEEGTHEQLLAKAGAYAGLWRRQSGGFRVDLPNRLPEPVGD